MKRHAPIILLLAGAFAIGIITVPAYGQSWDESNIYRYGRYATDAYRFLLHPANLPDFDTNLNLKGPAFFIAADLLARGLGAVTSTWSQTNSWHLAYFISFLAGTLALYLLAARWMSLQNACVVSLLFLSQPLLWGHAFINPKDIPYMTAFTATILCGFWMTDALRAPRWLDLRLVPAALLLGITSTMRVAGPLAGVIVLTHAIYRLRGKSFALVGMYLLLAAVAAYLSWPYLWGAPVSNFMESVTTMAEYPWRGKVLFAGQVYAPTDLPKSYFPALMGIQVTEPVLLFFGIGLGFSVLEIMRRRAPAPLILLAGWLVAPAFLIVGLGSTLYDNARQLYFLLPPIFIMAGWGLEKVLVHVRSAVAGWLLVILAITPGLVAAVQLHPYEYVYYNSLVGGTRGAYKRFEMDYWGTSARELTEYLNEVASGRTEVMAYGPQHIMQLYARRAVRVYNPHHDEPTDYDYIAILLRGETGTQFCSEAPIVHTVGRMGAVFSLLRVPPTGEVCR